jgi:hypothetical protein
MAVRPVFIPQADIQRPFREVPVSFQWHAGLARSQKQKSIESLHAAAKAALNVDQLLEISSKSPLPAGVTLSAFNLPMSLPSGHKCSVEAAYQGSKVTAAGGPYHDIYGMTSLEAKQDTRLKGQVLTGFSFFGTNWPLRPASLFYDWLYVTALCQPHNASSLEQVLRFGGFTDIEFNPARQVSCQARAAAILCGLVHAGQTAVQLADGTYLSALLKGCYGDKTGGRQKALFE